MSRVSTTCVVRGSDDADQSAGQTDSEDGDSRWFAVIAPALLGKDTGFQLHIATGFAERTCYRYAANDRKPPAYFLRALLRSDQGFTWLSAVMDGSDVTWWRELQAARDLCSKYKVEIRNE